MENIRQIKYNKDGSICRRGGKVGNKGNVHATGRKKIEGQETRKHISIKATDEEYKLLLQFTRILKADYESGLTLYKKLGSPPIGRAKKDDRKKHVIRVLMKEKQIIKDVLAIIKDRYELAYIAITNYE